MSPAYNAERSTAEGHPNRGSDGQELGQARGVCSRTAEPAALSGSLASTPLRPLTCEAPASLCRRRDTSAWWRHWPPLGAGRAIRNQTVSSEMCCRKQKFGADIRDALGIHGSEGSGFPQQRRWRRPPARRGCRPQLRSRRPGTRRGCPRSPVPRVATPSLGCRRTDVRPPRRPRSPYRAPIMLLRKKTAGGQPVALFYRAGGPGLACAASRRRAAMPASASNTTRCAALTVNSAWS
ncbi:hypothetical protein ACVWWN_004730 [Mycobacterium sp. URHB0021]